MTSLSILYLEDQQTCALKTQDDLASAKADANLSFDVTHVESLAGAIKELNAREFDAILSDLGLLDSNGTETVAALRHSTAQCPIVALTAHDSIKHMLACLRAGADDYLVKGQAPASAIVRALLNAIERRKTRLRLRNAQAKAEAIIHTVDDAILTFDADGVIHSVNPGVERMFGLRPEEIIRQPLERLIAAEHRSELHRRLQELVSSSGTETEPQKWQDEALHPSGLTFCVELTFCEITDGAKSRTFCAVIRDISQEKQRIQEVKDARDRAEAATQAKSEFLASMSHEIRTPLTAILGFAESLLVDQESLSIEDYKECVRTILRNGEHLTGLINDILDLAKIESGKFQIVPEPCSPYELTMDVIRLMQNRADAKKLSLVPGWPAELPETISIDGTRVRQVMLNFVSNAIKFTQQGSVTIALDVVRESESPSIIWRVIDTGIGMTEEQCGRVFQPFVQADKKTSHVFGGTGLGLTITKELVQMMGGELSVTSTPNQGSEFSVRFPLDTSARFTRIEQMNPGEQAGAQQESHDDPRNISLDCRVLLAEDGADNRRLISFILKKHGAEVATAENGAIACEMVAAAQAEETPYDVVLMDMQMPVLDGYGAARKLRNDDYSGPIIALTAHAMKGDRQQCLDAGCDDYATKPIDRDTLVQLVDRYSRIKGAQAPVHS